MAATDARRIRLLLMKKMAGEELTPAEEQELLSYEARHPENKAFHASMLEDDYQLEQLSEYRALMAWGQQQPFELPGKSGNLARLRSLRMWMGAAAAVLVCMVVYYWMTGGKGRPDRTDGASQDVQQIAAARPQAILTVQGKTRISLDSVPAGRVAAGVEKAVNGSLHYSMRDAGEEIVEHRVSTPEGGFYTLTLSDGTKVWLNAASSLTYLSAFTGAERRVRLEGEAYFMVAHQPEKPFVVDTRGGAVTALGTQFNVKSYEREVVTTSLLEGKVKIDNEKGQVPVLMTPGQQVKIDPASGRIRRVANADVESAIGWKEGLFSYSQTALPDVFRELERWYAVKMIYDEQALPNTILTGSFDRTLPLAALLEQLGPVAKVRFRIDGRRVIVGT